jgi:hypothetical protein
LWENSGVCAFVEKACFASLPAFLFLIVDQNFEARITFLKFLIISCYVHRILSSSLISLGDFQNNNNDNNNGVFEQKILTSQIDVNTDKNSFPILKLYDRYNLR